MSTRRRLGPRMLRRKLSRTGAFAATERERGPYPVRVTGGDSVECACCGLIVGLAELAHSEGNREQLLFAVCPVCGERPSE